VADDNNTTLDVWLPVIGNALAYLCLDKHESKYPDKMNSVLKKVKFLKGLGIPDKNAAGAAGSTANSVNVMKSRKRGDIRGRKK
jgi:hypothetical protein